MSDERPEGGPAPIPSEGTSAPPDANRVFGSAPPPSPYGAPPGGPAGSSGPSGSSTLSEEDERKLRSRARAAVILGVGAVIFAVLLFPLGLLMGVAAIVLGALARRGARPAGLRTPGAVPGIVLGILATIFASLVAVTAAVFWDEVNTYRECIEGANTGTAQQGCQDALIEQLNERMQAGSSR